MSSCVANYRRYRYRRRASGSTMTFAISQSLSTDQLRPMTKARQSMTPTYYCRYVTNQCRPPSISPIARAKCFQSTWKGNCFYTKLASRLTFDVTCGTRWVKSSSLSMAKSCPFSGNSKSHLEIGSNLNCFIVVLIHNCTCCSLHCWGSGEMFRALQVAWTSCFACWSASEMTGSMSPCCVKPPNRDSSANGFRLCLRWKVVSCRNSRNTWWSCCFCSRLSSKYLMSMVFSAQFGLKMVEFENDCSSISWSSILKLSQWALWGDGTPLESGGDGGKRMFCSCLMIVVWYSTEGQGDGELCAVVAGLIGERSEDVCK